MTRTVKSQDPFFVGFTNFYVNGSLLEGLSGACVRAVPDAQFVCSVGACRDGYAGRAVQRWMLSVWDA